MKESYKIFEQLINDTKIADALYKYMKGTVVTICFDDLLRWQYVQVVSALDKFVHDLVRIGMIEEFLGQRKHTAQYESFSIDMNTYSLMSSDARIAAIMFENKILAVNGYKSFQDPNKISEALAFIWDEKDKWKMISDKLGMSSNDCKTKLKNIVLRRNQIAHEGDYYDCLSGRQKIYESDVEDVRDFVFKVGNAIYNLVK